MRKYIILLMLLALAPVYAQKPVIIPPVQWKGGSFEYVKDEKGNRVPDYSYCGYMASEQDIPELKIKAVVPRPKGDATSNIQAALNYVSGLKPDANGFRGAVLLEPGVYEVSGTIMIKASGVVLRGSGAMEGGTEILATNRDRNTLIRFLGAADAVTEKIFSVSDEYVPVGSSDFFAEAHTLKQGDLIRIQRPGSLGKARNEENLPQARRMNVTDMVWERSVVKVEGNRIFLDAPLTYEISSQSGGADIALLKWPGRIQQCGLENMRLTSVYDSNNMKDENHSWIAVSMENTRDAWVRRVEFRHFAGSAVYITESSCRITVEDCKSLEPISETGGQRRYSFYTLGGQCLFQRIYAEYGYHDFAVGAYAPGPNAFVQCWSILPQSYSGTIDSWSSGVLFDICAVDGNALRFLHPNQADAFSGWTTTNSMFWNSTASIMSCPKPTVGQNWAFGAWAQFAGKGAWYSSNNHVSPWSLFYAQLQDRMGKQNANEDKLITLTKGGTSSAEDARKQTEVSRKPLMLLKDWIDSLSVMNPISLEIPLANVDLRTVWNKPQNTISEKINQHKLMELRNGLLLKDESILTGNRHNPSWWRGSVGRNADKTPHITRYALSPEGYGVLDDLDEMTELLLNTGYLVVDHNYGLWYDRRRDDHERTSRIDGEVRPPLYEQPFARSGQGKAWDGLSKYDLTKWNNWYWNRLKSFSNLADEKGLVLFHQQYFQHNIIEAGAHWADFPWRTANNVNETGFPEPVPYAGNKRVFMSEHFYDVSHPVRRELHRNYIRKCLNNFSDNGSVLQFISAEFTGPLHFMEFWLDVIAEWEKETGNNATIALSATKDVQDAILADPKRSGLVEVIDIRYWYIDANGKEFAPKAGLNLAPRQFERIERPAKTSATEVYNMVSKYRRQYPQKAVIYSANSYSEYAWAAFMAGASLCPLPKGLPQPFLNDAARLSPLESSCWLLGKAGLAYIAFPSDEDQIEIDLRNESKPFLAQWIDPLSGNPQGKVFAVSAGSVYKASGKLVLWLRQST